MSSKTLSDLGHSPEKRLVFLESVTTKVAGGCWHQLIFCRVICSSWWWLASKTDCWIWKQQVSLTSDNNHDLCRLRSDVCSAASVFATSGDVRVNWHTQEYTVTSPDYTPLIKCSSKIYKVIYIHIVLYFILKTWYIYLSYFIVIVLSYYTVVLF